MSSKGVERVGDLYRKAQSARRDALNGEEPATEAQLAYLRRLLIEESGAVDEVWMAALTKRRASREIAQRVGVNG